MLQAQSRLKRRALSDDGNFRMRRPLSALLPALPLLLLAACSGEAPAPADPVTEAWVRLPAVEGRPGAAYFALHGGEAGDTLITVESERADRVELHETGNDNGRMTMRPIESAEIPPGETVTFEPGGRHAMLFGIDPEIAPGDPLPLDFRFDSGRDMRVEAVTVGAGDASPFATAAER